MEKTDLFAAYGEIEDEPTWSKSWRISVDVDGERLSYHADENKDIRFSRKVDCELAIKALVDNGIVTGEQLLHTPDSVWIPIAMSGLQW